MIYALLETSHLLFHDPHFDIQGLMKLHEPIDVGCKSINSILHYRESFVHLLTETTKFESDKPFKSCKALIDGSSLLCRILLRHLPYLAALSPFKSQDLKSTSFYYLVRPVQNRLRNRQADLLRRLQVDDQLKLHGLLHGEVSRLGAFKDFVHVSGSAAP